MAAKIYELVTHAKCLGQDCLNRWHFIDPDGSGDPLVLCEKLHTQVLAVLAPDLSNAFVWSSIVYEQIYPGMMLQHEYTTGFPLAGGDATAPAETFVAATVKWNLGDTVHTGEADATKHIKRGGKRIAGLPYNSYANNQFVGVAQRAAVNTAMGNLWGGSMGAFLPVVVHFPKSPAPIPPAKTTPRLPATRWAPILGHSLSLYSGSQVSRKQGHGK